MSFNIADVFETIELDLIKSMKKNMKYHFKDEEDLEINYNQWQIDQLSALEDFKKRNPKLFKGKFSEVNMRIGESLKGRYKGGRLGQEKTWLKAIKEGYRPKGQPNLSGNFFQINDRKLISLINSTTKDMTKAEASLLRRTNDLYRETIIKTQANLNMGAKTLDQAIDMATHDFLANGINSITYSNGRVVNIRSYSEMALRTANTRAQLMGEGSMREELGEHLVKMSSYGQCSETCLPFQGQVYIDDVYSGGKKGDGDYPLLSTAMGGGAFHPNCKHTLSTYYEGISKPPKEFDYDIKGPENPTDNQERNNIEANIRRYRRLEEGSLHKENIEKYHNKRIEWENKLKELDKPVIETPKIIEPVKPKEEFKFKQGANRDEIEDRMSNLVGPEYINLGRMHKDVANNYLEGIEKVYNEYPQLKNYKIDTINTNVKGQGELAHYGKTGTPINKGGKRYYRLTDELSFKSPRNLDKYQSDLEYSISTNFQYKNANAVTTAIHEETHWIDSLLGAKKNGLLVGNKYADVPAEGFSWSKFTVSDEIIEKAYKKILGYDFKSTQSMDILRELGPKYNEYARKRSEYAMGTLKPVIGKYAFTNNQEMLAQCISYELGGQHNEFTSIVKEIFDKYVEEYL